MANERVETKVLNQDVTDAYAIYHGDCVQLTKSIPDNSIHHSIYSPPFESLYTYSASDLDLGNCKDSNEFAEHFKFLAKELYRVMMPGRCMSFHCMNLPTSKSRDGYIGIRDFRGELIRMFQAEGFIFHSEVCIWKDPVTAMQRTKALGLLHKQLCKDSAMSRQGIPDYLVTMRKPGDNPEPVAGMLFDYVGDDLELQKYEYKSNDYMECFRRLLEGLLAGKYKQGSYEIKRSIDIWQRYASPVWMDINPSRTLQKESAREAADERHICPLQLDVIERALQLWTNPGDTVLSPFMGIGSEGYVATKMGRKFVGIELKESYYKQAQANINNAAFNEQRSLLSLLETAS